MTPPVAPLRSRRGVFDAVVRSNRCLCDEHHLLRLDAGRDFPPSCPGQFVQLACGRGDEGGGPVVHPWLDDAPPRIGRPELVESLTLLRRPFSLAGREQVGTRTVLDIVCRVVGRSSAQLAGLGEGDAVSVMGPLGNCFRWPDDMTLGVLVGGGVGLGPLLYLAEALHRAGKKVVAFAGAKSASLLPLTLVGSPPADRSCLPGPWAAEFAKWGARVVIATEDGSVGFAGQVTDALWKWLDGGPGLPADTVVYTCGPEPMLRALASGCAHRGLACQAAMERRMACGVGACQSCACKVKAQAPPGWRYELVCTDGPVFDAHDLVWD